MRWDTFRIISAIVIQSDESGFNDRKIFPRVDIQLGAAPPIITSEGTARKAEDLRYRNCSALKAVIQFA
jgi:hypothetical protein